MKNVLTADIFEFVLINELKRALRSQSFVTLVQMEPRGDGAAAAIPEIAGLVSRELRETDILATGPTTVSMVLLDADLQDSNSVIDRVLSRLEHYQFTAPVAIEVGAACCPTHGADLDTLKQVAASTRTGLTRREPRGNAHAQ